MRVRLSVILPRGFGSEGWVRTKVRDGVRLRLASKPLGSEG